VVQSINFYRLSGGEFVEEHGQPDMLGLLQQIGGGAENLDGLLKRKRLSSRTCWSRGFFAQLWG
jgi:hypothetical protein